MHKFAASLMLISVVGCVQPCFADDSEAAQQNSDAAAYSLSAAPVYFAAATGDALSAGTKRVVKLVDKTGKALGELTSDVIDDVSDAQNTSDAPKVTLNQKQIPLVVRGDYVQMNEKVKAE